MLKKMTLRNFKLFDESGVTLHPGRITVLIGVNGSGKSTILQALQILKQSCLENTRGMLKFDGPEISPGSFSDVVHQRDMQRTISLSLDVSYEHLDALRSVIPPIPTDGLFAYSVEQPAGHGFKHCAAIYRGDTEYLGATWDQNSEPSPKQLSFNDAPDSTVTSVSLRTTGYVGRPLEVGVYSNSPQLQASGILPDLEALLATVQQFLQGMLFTPAIRGFDRPTYAIQADHVAPIEGDRVAAQAGATANLIAERPDLVDEVSKRLHAVLGTNGRILRHRIAKGRIVAEMAKGKKAVNLLNEAFGLNQLVPPLLDLVRAERGATVAIEEPEIHLHPRAQANLADVFVEFATAEDMQIIITTHSEHILMALLSAIAEGRLKPEELAVYELWPEEGAVRAKRLEINQYGQIEGGLREFMEVDVDRVGELIAARFR